jgi:hypothetical protein
MADELGETVQLLQLAVIAVIAYLAYRAWSTLTNKGGTNCGPNGGQPCCDPSQVNTNNCVGANGNPCGTWEFWTATTCYQGTPSVTTQQIQAAEQGSSTLGGIGAVLNPPSVPSAPVPGLPVGYDPVTGTIDSGVSGGVPTWGITPGTSLPATDNVPVCQDMITGNTYPC